MAHIKTTAKFDYRWPSGSVTAFPAGYEGVVKREIVNYAVAKGLGVDMDVKAKGGTVKAANYKLDTGPTEAFAPTTDNGIVVTKK